MYRAIKRPKLYAVHCPIHYSSNIPALRSYGLLCYPAAQSPTPMLPAGGGWKARWRHTYLRPKDSNTAVRVRDHATGKVLEGADRQTDKQTVHAL